MKRLIIILFLYISHNSIASPLLLMDSYSARSYALAESGVSLRDDIYMLNINPASIAGLRYFTLGASYLLWYESTSFFSAIIGTPLKIRNRNLGFVSLNFSVFSIGSFENYDKLGNRLSDLEAGDLLLNLGYGKSIFKGLDIGINLKYINSRLGPESSKSFSFDTGVISYFRVPAIKLSKNQYNLNIGLSIQNTGLAQRFINDKISLPFKIRAGINYRFFSYDDAEISFISESIYNIYRRLKSVMALEFFILKYYYIRAGYNFADNVLHRYSVGIGVYDSRDGYNLIFDYSYIPLIELQNSHIFSLKIEIGDVFKKLEATSEQTNK